MKIVIALIIKERNSFNNSCPIQLNLMTIRIETSMFKMSCQSSTAHKYTHSQTFADKSVCPLLTLALRFCFESTTICIGKCIRRARETERWIEKRNVNLRLKVCAFCAMDGAPIEKAHTQLDSI